MSDPQAKDERCFHVEVRLRHEDSGEKDSRGLAIMHGWWECRRCQKKFIGEPQPARSEGLSASQRALLEGPKVIRAEREEAIAAALAEIDRLTERARASEYNFRVEHDALVAAEAERDALKAEIDQLRKGTPS